MARSAGGVDRTHARSTGPKLVFVALHSVVVILGLWLAFGAFDWPDPLRARILALCAVLYGLRHAITLFVLLKRKVDLGEALGLMLLIALIEIGFLLLGAGLLSGTKTPLGVVDWIGIGLLLSGSVLNTLSEFQRWTWKKQPASKGRCYTKGLFAYAMHINYFGDSLLFTGWAMLTLSLFALAVPAMITLLFIFFHIPPLDAYLATRYGDEFKDYASRTAKFVPFVY